MDVTNDPEKTGSRNKDVWHVGFAKYKQMGRYFSEVEKNMQNGWFLLPVGDATQTEEEKLTAAGQMQQDLLSLQFAHITLLAVYESSISREKGGQNGEPTLRKETFLMIPYGKDFTEKFYLETVKTLAVRHKQSRFFARPSFERSIKKYQRENAPGIQFAECESGLGSVEEVLDNGLPCEEYHCVFKGYRTPSSWIDAVVMERSGMLWQ